MVGSAEIPSSCLCPVPYAMTRGFEVSQEDTLLSPCQPQVHKIPSFKIQFLYMFHILEKGNHLGLKVLGK